MGDVSKTADDKEIIDASKKSSTKIDIPIISDNGSQEVVQKIHAPSVRISQDILAGETKAQTEKLDRPPTEEKNQKSKMEEPTESSLSVDTLSEKEMKGQCEHEEVSGVENAPKTIPVSASLDKKPRVGSAASALNPNERIVRNQSDIFSLKEQTSIASSIFSVNGSPSRKVYRNRELSPSNVFPFGQNFSEPHSEDPVSSPRDRLRQGKDNYNDIKRPSSSIRNPLTGTGLSSNDEYKFKGSKRKDGNPLLGLGYSPEVTPSTHRIPPGGYSHKLW